MAYQKDKPFGSDIHYYCKDCEKIVDAQKVGRKYVFRCPICKTKNVAFGTDKSLNNFFHIDEKRSEAKKASSKKEVENNKVAEEPKEANGASGASSNKDVKNNNSQVGQK